MSTLWSNKAFIDDIQDLKTQLQKINDKIKLLREKKLSKHINIT